METQDSHNTLYADIRVLNELLRSFRSDTQKELVHIRELQHEVTAIKTRCEDKTCGYDKILDRFQEVRDYIPKCESKIGSLEDSSDELREVVKSNTENARANLWNIITLAASLLAIGVSVYTSLK